MPALQPQVPQRPGDDEALAELDTLAAELGARGLTVRLVTPEGRLPHLAVHLPAVPALAERIYAQADWHFWPYAERIAACDDVMTAADTIVRVLRAAGGAPDA
jgi:hypothetical protein